MPGTRDMRQNHDAFRASNRLFWCGVAGIVTLALVIRLTYLFQIESIPFFYHLVGDAASYWNWAGRIAGGDWLGTETFYQAPAYPYFLAVVRLLVGDDLWWARIVQIALGALSCGLLAIAGRKFISAEAGFFAGLIVAFYGPAIFFDGLIQKAALSLFLLSLLLCLLGALMRGGERSTRQVVLALAAGVVLGLLALTREQALLLGLVVIVWLTVRRRGFQRALAARPASVDAEGHPTDKSGWFIVPPVACLLGMSIVLAPVALRNYAIGGEIALTTFQAGPNFYIGNHAGATGRYVPLKRGHESARFERQDATELAETALGRTLTPREVSRYWLGGSWAYIKQHPMRWTGLLLRKWMLVWNAYEIPDTESYTLYARFSWLLAVCGGLNHFGVLCPLAVIGVAATMRRWRQLWLLYALMATAAVGVAAFYVFGRYRYPLVPLLAIFAGAGLGELRRTLRTLGARHQDAQTGDRPPRRGAVAVLVVAVAILTNLRVNPERELDGLAYANLGVVLGQQQKYAAAIEFLELAVQAVPDSSETHYNLGTAYSFSGEYDRALAHFRRAQELDPHLMAVDSQMGAVYEIMGRPDDAIRHYKRALAIDPSDQHARQALERL